MLKWFKKFSTADSAWSLYEWVGWLLAKPYSVAAGAGMSAWLSTYWGWYWETFNLAGIAIAFLVAIIVFPSGLILAAKARDLWPRQKIGRKDLAERERGDEPAVKAPPGEPALVRNIRLSRSKDATSHWSARCEVNRRIERMQVCLRLQYFGADEKDAPPRWWDVVQHPMLTRTNLAANQTLSIPLMDDAPFMFEDNAPCWLAPEAFPATKGFQPADFEFARCALVFVSDDHEQEHKFILLPREKDQASVLIGEESLAEASFWAPGYKPISYHSAQGLRVMPKANGR